MIGQNIAHYQTPGSGKWVLLITGICLFHINE
jgi:hypothetical protein